MRDLSFRPDDNPAVRLLMRDAAVREAVVVDTAVVRAERRPKLPGSAKAIAWDEAGLDLMRHRNDADADSVCALFRRAADTGYAPAQYRLGYCYESGSGAAKDEAMANAWYLKAAQQGQVDAQFKLGYSYRVGRGTKIDLPEALRWYKAAAANGDLDALYSVGYMIANGQGVAADKKAAYDWYLRAAGEGSAPAQYELVHRLHDGDGVAKDPAGAYAWLLVLRARSKELTPDAAQMLEMLGHTLESDVDTTARAAAEPRARALMQALAKRYVARLGR
jgi:TPR repeat protein